MIGKSKYGLGNASAIIISRFMWPVGMPNVFHRPLKSTVPLHTLTTGKSGQGDCEGIYMTQLHKDHLLQKLQIIYLKVYVISG